MNMEECVKWTFTIFAYTASAPSAHGLVPWFVLGVLILLLLEVLDMDEADCLSSPFPFPKSIWKGTGGGQLSSQPALPSQLPHLVEG